MIPYSRALPLLMDAASPLGSEWVRRDRSGGRTAARDLQSPEALPPFHNSAMDGFALALTAAEGQMEGTDATPEVGPGLWLPVTGRVLAGDPEPRGSGVRPAPQASGVDGVRGRAVEISTGAPLPSGCDRVVPIEDVELEASSGEGPAWIRLRTRVEEKANVRPYGGDVAAGRVYLARGHRIGATERALLAALGVERLPVVRKPRVAILNTGAELMISPDAPPGPGQIRNSNGPLLQAFFESWGAEVVMARILPDEVEPFLQALAEIEILDADLVVTTGALSRGSRDFVPGALETAGAQTLFRKVAIRPGKPLLAARLQAGGLLVGLPGNPGAVAVGTRFFLLPLLRRWAGWKAEGPLRLPLAGSLELRPGLTYFLAAKIEPDDEGAPRVRVLPDQRSHRLLPLTRAGCWVVAPPSEGSGDRESGEESTNGFRRISAGDLVEVREWGLNGGPNEFGGGIGSKAPGESE